MDYLTLNVAAGDAPSRTEGTSSPLTDHRHRLGVFLADLRKWTARIGGKAGKLRYTCQRSEP